MTPIPQRTKDIISLCFVIVVFGVLISLTGLPKAAFYFFPKTAELSSAQTSSVDLVADSIWVDPVQPLDGSPVIIHFRVKNTGTRDAATFHAILNKVSFGYQKTEQPLSVSCDRVISGLKAGESFEADTSSLAYGCTDEGNVFPLAQKPGFYISLSVNDDGPSAIPESSKENNFLSKSWNVYFSADAGAFPSPPPSSQTLAADIKINNSDGVINALTTDSLKVAWTSKNFSAPDASCAFTNEPPGSQLESATSLSGSATINYSNLQTTQFIDLILTCYDGPPQTAPRAQDTITLFLFPPSPTPDYTSISAGVSTKFKIGDRVRTTSNLNARTQPAVNAEIITTVGFNSTGVILDGPVSMDGYWWWQVRYGLGATIGWSVENYLEKIPDGPTISSLTPSFGPVGTVVIARGQNFLTDNEIYILPPNLSQELFLINAPSYDGTSLSFIIPESIVPACSFKDPPCTDPDIPVLPGRYGISMGNNYGISNTLPFTVEEGPAVTESLPPAPVSPCIKTGCSYQICAPEPVATSCQWDTVYLCYQEAACEIQPSGDCGWTMTEDLQFCIDSGGMVTPEEAVRTEEGGAETGTSTPEIELQDRPMAGKINLRYESPTLLELTCTDNQEKTSSQSLMLTDQ